MMHFVQFLVLGNVAALRASGGYQEEEGDLLADCVQTGSAVPDAIDPDTITLLPMDFEKTKKSFKLPVEAAKTHLNLINNMDDIDGEEIPLLKVDTKTLEHVVDFVERNGTTVPEDIQKPLKSTAMSEMTTKENAEWIDSKSQDEVFNLVLASNFLDAKALLDLTCVKVASQIKGKDAEEIRKHFNIVGDFTEEEKEQFNDGEQNNNNYSVGGGNGAASSSGL